MSLSLFKGKDVTITVLMTAVIFIIDLLTPLWYDTWVFYLVPLYFIYYSVKRLFVYSAVVIFLIVTGLFLHPHGTFLMHSAVDRITGIAGVWGISVLLMRLTVYRGIDRANAELRLVETRLKASLREKETLLRELYHRTKNNMQVISNLIDLQTAYVNDEKTLQLFKEVQNRIEAMALVHEKLCQSMDLSNIDLKEYVRDLAKALLEGYQLNVDRISLKLDVDSISVSIDTATPCGLIINELISNSLKHAFPGNRRGEISIALHRTEEGEIELLFSDNGVGLPKSLDFSNIKSLGLNLVKNLGEKQLNGTVDLGTNCPTEFLIKFKEPIYLRRV